MRYINQIATELFSSWGLEGTRLDIVTSIVLAIGLMLFVVIVGFAIEKLDQFLLTTTSVATGVKAASFIVNRVMFIGTVFHELSHALFAVVTGAKVKKIRCFTLFSKEMLGYVEFIPRGNKIKQSIQLSLVSCAPVMTGFVTVPLFFSMACKPLFGLLLQVLFGYCAISILCHMSMSKWDLKLYAKGAVFTLPLLTVFIFIARFFLMSSAIT